MNVGTDKTALPIKYVTITAIIYPSLSVHASTSGALRKTAITRRAGIEAMGGQ